MNLGDNKEQQEPEQWKYPSGFQNKRNGHVALAQKGKVERNLPVKRENNKGFVIKRN